MADVVDSLLKKHKLISDQVNKEQVRVILTELESVLERGISGEIVEFGCYIGTTSLFIARLLQEQWPEHSYHVYDSFAGLPSKTAEDTSSAGEQFQAGELAVSKKQFVREFQKANLPLPVIHKGWFEELTDSDIPDAICFAFLDGDFYTSIRTSLKLVSPRMKAGGVIIIDDYAREALPGAARAVHELFSQANVQTMHNLGIIRV